MVSKGDADGDEELALATRAAWLYHVGEFTQSEVAARLGVTSIKAHRLISRAVRAGAVRVFVEGSIGDCIAVEEDLQRRYGLRSCRVVPSLGEQGLPLRAIGRAAAIMLTNALQHGDHRLIGVGHGRSLAATVEHLPRIPAPNVCFISLLGGLARRIVATPFEVIQDLAEKTGSDAWLMPVPMFANAAADRAVLLAQRGVTEAMALAAQATLCFVGVGEVAEDAFLAMTGTVDAAQVERLRKVGAVGELLGRYFDADGRLVNTDLHERTIALQLTAMKGDVIAVAGGPGKVAAIRSILRSGYLTGLITDEPSARQLLEQADPHAPQQGRTKQWTKRPRISAKSSSRVG